jgi:hypothetical protein
VGVEVGWEIGVDATAGVGEQAERRMNEIKIQLWRLSEAIESPEIS